MRTIIKINQAGKIADIQKRDDLILVSDSQDIDAIKDYFGNCKSVQDFDGFLVKIEDGDYSEIYGFSGNIPYFDKSLFKIERVIK